MKRVLRQGNRSSIESAANCELALVRESRTGSRAAFDQLVERYHRRALNVAGRRVGDAHDAQDVVQVAFERAYRHVGHLEDEYRFGSWLLRIVTNLALNHRRDRAVDRNRRHPASGRDSEEPLDGLPARTHPPYCELLAAELSETLRSAIESLPQRQRAALLLFSVENLPQQTVAAIMDCSVGAVKWHVFQARRQLRARLSLLLEVD